MTSKDKEIEVKKSRAKLDDNKDKIEFNQGTITFNSLLQVKSKGDEKYEQDYAHSEASREDRIPDGKEADELNPSGVNRKESIGSRNNLVIDGAESQHTSNCRTYTKDKDGKFGRFLLPFLDLLYMVYKQSNGQGSDINSVISRLIPLIARKDADGDLNLYSIEVHNESEYQPRTPADGNENIQQADNRKQETRNNDLFLMMKKASEAPREVNEISCNYDSSYRGNIPSELQAKQGSDHKDYEKESSKDEYLVAIQFHKRKKDHTYLPAKHKRGGKRITDRDKSESDTTEGKKKTVFGLRSGGRPRGVPLGPQNSQSTGEHGSGGSGQPVLSEFQLFLKFWKVNFDENSRQQLRVALNETCSEPVGTQSTMLLLDTSASITEENLAYVKTTVEQILGKAEDASRSNSKEAYGLAVFGRFTRILHMPTTNYDDIIKSLELMKTSGLSPLGLGLIMCAGVWLRSNGLPGTVWIHGRKVSSKIIVITDFKPNQTVKTDERRETPEDDDLDGNERVYLELKEIAESLAKLQLPVYVIPARTDCRNKMKMRRLAKTTGGELLDDSDKIRKIGWRARLERFTCVAISEPETELESTLEWICDNEEEVTDVRNMAMARRSLEVKLVNFNWNCLGEPGQHFHRGLFALGTRVCQINVPGITGTVISHSSQNRLTVLWDWTETLEDCEMSDIRHIKTHRTLPKSVYVQPIIGCKVKLMHEGKSENPRNSDDRCGTVVGVARLQRNVFYISWENDEDTESQSDREISRYLHPDEIECERVSWFHNVSGTFEEFDIRQNDKLETIYRKRKNKTARVTIGGHRYFATVLHAALRGSCKQTFCYRAIFHLRKLRQLDIQTDRPVEFQIKRDPDYMYLID